MCLQSNSQKVSAPALSRRAFHRLAFGAIGAHLLSAHSPSALWPEEAKGFTHPGMLHSNEDLIRIRLGVQGRSQPIFSGYEVFQKHPQSQPDYIVSGPFAEIGRNPNVHSEHFDSDANAAYQCALMWAITQRPVFAGLSIQIVDAWAAKLEFITGADAALCASLGGFKLLNAAELLRYTNSGWADAGIEMAQHCFKDVVLPVLLNFAPFANGNWDAACIKTMLAIGIFCEDRELFERALQYYLHGCGNGRLTHYIDSTGQCQESGRDQQHTQLGLAHLGDACEMAWHQGLDLYSAEENRLLSGFEYTAAYNLGHSVPFHPDSDQTGKYQHTAISPRSSFRPIYEQIFNHYVHRMGLSAPYTEEAAGKIRPEGAAHGADHPGFGTLLFTRSHSPKPQIAPVTTRLSGLYAEGKSDHIKLCWPAVIGASQYSVLRKSASQRGYQEVASRLETTAWEDRSVQSSELYSYVIVAGSVGRHSNSVEAMANLPKGWKQRTLGTSVAGCASFVRNKWQLHASGSEPFTPKDDFHLVYRQTSANPEISARLLPCIASQFLTTGVIIRDRDPSKASEIALVISPETRGVERPNWRVSMLERCSPGVPAHIVGMMDLSSPIVEWGRIVRPIWLRLAGDQGLIRAAVSSDGESWQPVADAKNDHCRQAGSVVGLLLCSGLGSEQTTCTFDHVT